MKSKIHLLAIGFLLVSIVSFGLTPVCATEPIAPNIYEVKAGDTLPKLAVTFDTTIEELKVSNGLQSDSLFVGQKLWVPIVYEVVAGDTLKNLAITHNSTPDIIKSTNGLESEQLYTGQLLKIVPKKMQMQGQHILMTREEFKNWLFHNQFNRQIQIIQQHHTWLPSYDQFKGNNHFQMLTSMENFHKKEKGWQNIAQNITTFPDGTVAVSRPFNVAPEGSIGEQANSVGLAIEHIGNFDVGHDVMTAEQKETIVYITALLCLKFGLSPTIDHVTYHHWWHLRSGERVLDNSPEYNVKSCPGTGFFGGNTTQHAKEHFYPLISKKMEELAESNN
ncbi:LysM peptidoglycan-binding domain-containing protein [Alkalihalobacillus sp. MEB130]|uniref:LysM peptidoglycan-binding domain-containing protein n=1 Tax=Alkalihalobacillus sp. MEB130 TaxID=2976704 RepID=UPI0028DFB818|nr:LysM peptidoglycan-binding domain-containing protein [Alkalihalobacillus sp. MEB130]MDT8860127.1 LysM peptidoglycan-binding domain-containing protein [Alkalihalobacillus sp. MEB130]